MSFLSPATQGRLDRKLHALNALRPLPATAVEKLRQSLQIEMTYNSNAIEGNSLTLKETFLVINEGITVKGKPLKDHLEAKDHHAALEYLYEFVEHERRQTISERLVRTLHQMIVQETDKEWAGRYRNAEVIIGGASHKPPRALDVPKKMEELIHWLQKARRTTHPVELAALLHHKLVFIHPFFDGNGRTARLTTNLLFMQAGFPLVVVLKNDRKRYYDVLGKADKGQYEPLIRFIAQAVERSLDIYLNALIPDQKKTERLLPLSAVAKRTPYSAKYLNLLIRSGKLEGHKEGRSWLTSEEAVSRYIEQRERKR